MPAYAILGSTGNTGSSLIENLLNSPENKIHAFCRNKSKLLTLVPAVIENKQVTLFEGDIHDVDLIADCIRDTKAVFLAVTTNTNAPGCHVSQDIAATVISALQKLRDQSRPGTKLPKLLLLSSATIDDHLARHMGLFRPIMLAAANHVYNDLRLAEKLLRAQEDWITTIYIKPAGLSPDISRGHKLSLDEEESFISYLDLAGGMIEAADNEDGYYDSKNVCVVLEKMAESPIHLSLSQIEAVKNESISNESVEECNRLLQKNHEQWHMFFRDTAGHNHIAHSLLTHLSLGASPQALRDRYEDGTPIQRPIPEIDSVLLEKLADAPTLYSNIGEITQYHTFLEFFKRQIAAKGWKNTVQEYLFSRTDVAEKMLARMYEGAYHPIIHLGLGIEFNEEHIIAEGLAQAASHDDSQISKLLLSAEAEAAIAYPPARPKPMIELIHEVRASEDVRSAPRWSDFGNKMRDGIVGRACEQMSTIAAQFFIRQDEEELRRRTAEMISTCAFFAGAAQRQGRPRKIDFFYMHCVTSSIFFSVLVRQDWIKLADRVRLVEWKARLDLAWYAVCGSAPLDGDAISGYEDPTQGSPADWPGIFRAVTQEHDDGHAAKFVRAVYHGKQVAAEWEVGEWEPYFPMKGDMWLKLARMCQDTTKDIPLDLKWVPFTGFEQPWKRPDLANSFEQGSPTPT
ncbi:putative HypA [Seiridium unicorne]|uniref:HypA n=1 Tax=Seiridium unicorne TaxID=138068 RepID=A0ABR2UUI2_9PEZI